MVGSQGAESFRWGGEDEEGDKGGWFDEFLGWFPSHFRLHAGCRHKEPPRRPEKEETRRTGRDEKTITTMHFYRNFTQSTAIKHAQTHRKLYIWQDFYEKRPQESQLASIQSVG